MVILESLLTTIFQIFLSDFYKDILKSFQNNTKYFNEDPNINVLWILFHEVILLKGFVLEF